MSRTLEQIVQEAITESSRPDLTTILRSRIRDILRKCHAYADFNRDLKDTALVAVPSNVDAKLLKVQITVPSLFRKFKGIACFDEDGTELDFPEFRQKTVVAPKTYFGDTLPYLYTIQGGTCTVEFRTAVVPSFIALRYFAYPEITDTTVDGVATYTSADWMLGQHDGVVLAAALAWIAEKTEAGNAASYKNDLEVAVLELVNAEGV